MKKCMLTTAAAMSAFALFGAELTWKGPAQGYLSEATNWEPEQAPASGDTLKFSGKVVALPESIDIGADGMTLDVTSGTLTTTCKFTGDGALTKDGAGVLFIAGLKNSTANNWDYKGGTIINDGEFRIDATNSASAYAVGQGDIIVNRTAGKAPVFHYRQGGLYFPTIRITGADNGKPAIKSNGSPEYTNPIYAEDDFLYGVDYGYPTFSGGIKAPGKTMRVGAFEYAPYIVVTFNCKIDCSLDIGMNPSTTHYINTLTFASNFRLDDPAQTITIRKVAQKDGKGTGQVAFNTGSICNGKLITTSECGEVVVNGSTTFKGFGSMELAAATKLTIADGKKVDVGGCKFGDAALAAGTYAWDETAGGWVLDDAGSLVVREKVRDLAIYSGAADAENDWQDPACWLGGRVPKAGGYVVVEKKCAFTYYDPSAASGEIVYKEFDVGDEGITIDTPSGAKVSIAVKLTGNGSVTKEGTGTLYIRNGIKSPVISTSETTVSGTAIVQSYRFSNTYAGGTYIRNGQINLQTGDHTTPPTQVSDLGTGGVHIVRQTGINPTLRRRSGYINFGTIYVEGPEIADQASILWNGTATLPAAIVAEENFIFGLDFGTVTFAGPITAHGKRIIFAKAGWTASDAIFVAPVDATVVFGLAHDGNKMRDMKFQSGCLMLDPEATITMAYGQSASIEGGAKICGNYVHNAASSGVAQALTVSGKNIYVKSMTVADAALMTVADGAEVTVNVLKIGETVYAEGVHTIGGGTFTVDPDYSLKIWTGNGVRQENGATGWHYPENWNDGVPAAGGDYVYFPKGDDISSGTEVDLTGNMTVEVAGSASIVNTWVKFTGTGDLIKEGAGRFSFGRQNTSDDKGAISLPTKLYPTYGDNGGKTIVNNGTLFVYVSASSTPCFTLPYIEVNRADGRSPKFYHRLGVGKYDEIRITGPYAAGKSVIGSNGNDAQFGDIYATDDIEVMIEYNQPRYNNFYINGHTVWFYGSWDSDQIQVKLNGVVDGNCRFGKSSYKFGQVLLESGFSTTGSISVTRVKELKMNVGAKTGAAISSDNVPVVVAERANIDKAATLTLDNGATIALPDGMGVRVAGLTVDGQVLANGTYTKDSLAGERAFITGGGALMVGPAPGMMMIVH